MKYEKPSKVRRRQRRRSARINKRVTDVQMKIHDTQYHTDEMRDEIINSSPDAKPTFNVLVQEDGHDFENLTATPQRSEDTYTAFDAQDRSQNNLLDQPLSDVDDLYKPISKLSRTEFS